MSLKPEEIEDIKSQICDEYCRYPYDYEDIREFCANCPLNKLDYDEIYEFDKAIWKYTSDGYPYCSNCKMEVTGRGGVVGHESPFCPYCGSKMIRSKGDWKENV